MSESQLAARICRDLGKLGILAVIIRAEARTRWGAPAAPKGWPDIRVEPLGWLELGKRRRKEKGDQKHQSDLHRKIRAVGGRVEIAETYEEAIAIVMRWRDGN